jgi:hypothetical protein
MNQSVLNKNKSKENDYKTKELIGKGTFGEVERC